MKRLIAIVMLLSVLLSAFLFVKAESSSEFIDFSITDLYVRSGENGEYVKDWYTIHPSGFMLDKNPYLDRDYNFSKVPEEFINAAYIQTRKNDVNNSLFISENTTDWLKFNINKSSTVYIVDYQAALNTPKWIKDEGWETTKREDVESLLITVKETTPITSTFIHKKHFDVADGGTTTVKIGGYKDKCYNTYNIIVIPDEKKEEKTVIFKEEELKKENWENEVASSKKDAVIMFEGSNKAFKYGIKENIDVRPVKKDNEFYLPVSYFAGLYGGTITNNILTYNNNTYNLTDNSVVDNGNYLMDKDNLSEIFGKTVSVTDDGLIFVTDGSLNITKDEQKRILSLYLVNIINIELRVKYASPGDELIIDDGEYFAPYMKLSGYGTEEKPIVIRPKTPGGAKITGTGKVIIGGEYIHFKDFYFDKTATSTSVITFTNAEYCRVSDCYFYYGAYNEGSPNYHVIYFGEYSKHCRLDHNTFERSNGCTIGFALNDHHTEAEMAQYHRVDHNYFFDIRLATDEHPTQSNGRECLMVGTSSLPDRSAYLVCEYNLFEDCYGDGNEIISNKSSDNIYRYNTFFQTKNLRSAVSIRTGDRIVFNRNYFINGFNGITSHGHDNVITNNYFYNIKNHAIALATGNYNTFNRHYKQNVGTVVANNQFVDVWLAGISLGRGYLNNNNSYTYAPKDTKIYNNASYKIGKNGSFIRDEASYSSDLKNNITNLEKGTFGATYTDDEVLKTGKLYIPENISSYEEKGYYDSVINEFDDYYDNNSTLDIGINNFNSEVIEKTFVDINDVGPINRWWVAELRTNPSDISDYILQDKEIKSVTASTSTLVASKDRAYNLDEITYTVTYSDDTTTFAPHSDIEYEITADKDGIFRIENGKLYTSGAGTGTLKATYEGFSRSFTIVGVESLTSYTDDFSTDYFLSNYERKGYWKVDDGKLKNVYTSSNYYENYAISRMLYLKGDYKISFDIAMKGNNNPDAPDANCGVIIGAKDDNKNDYYRINLCEGDYSYSRVTYHDGYYISSKVGDVYTEEAETGVFYHVTVVKNGEWLVTTFNGKIASVVKVPENLEGNFGFVTRNNLIEVDNLVIESIDFPQASVETIDINATRTDICETQIVINDNIKKDIMYRIERNGLWMCDTTDYIYYDFTMQDESNQYSYTVYAIDEEGNVVGRGTESVSLENIPDSMFYISDLQYKLSGADKFVDTGHYANNKGMGAGSATEGIWYDQYYVFDKIPEEFENAAYIRTLRNYGKNELNAVSGADEWMRFNLNNKSATVYVIMFDTSVPNWITNGGWESADYKMDVYNGSNYIVSTQNVFKKHFDVAKGGKTTVTLGAHNDVVSYHYAVIVVPDKSKKVSITTNISDETFYVTPGNGIQSGNVLYFTCYKDNKLVYLKSHTFVSDEVATFTPDVLYDYVRIMLFENNKNIKPLSIPQNI